MTSISANVDASISALSKDVNEQSAIVDAALRATNEALERQASAIAALERTHGAAVESARASLSGAIDELKRRAEEGARANEKTSTELQSTVAQIVQRIDDTRELLRKETLSAVGEVRTAITEAVLERLEELSRRMLDLRTGPEEIAQVLRGVVHEQSSDVGTRWDDLVSTLARQRGYNGMASADDVFLVALVRSLEQVLDERDRRLVTMLDGIARSLPSRRRAGFLSRARKTIAETDEPGSKPSL